MDERKKTYDCDMVQDLMPLYFDEVCSKKSREIVEEHIQTCEHCNHIFLQLKNTTYDDRLIEEKTNVLARHERVQRRKSMKIAITTAGILMIPIIVCLICNIAIGHALDWFFIVLTSLMVFASLTIVPLVVLENKVLWSLGSFFVSIELLFLSICIYTHTNWFFLVSVPLILGLSILFMPYLLRQMGLPSYLEKKKGLIAMLWDTAWLFGVIFVCGFFTSYAYYWHNAILITLFGLAFPWSAFFIVRYLKIKVTTKVGIIFILYGILSAISNDIVALIIGNKVSYMGLWHVNLLVWNSPDVLNANINFLIGLGLIVIGAIVMLAGSLGHKK